MVVLYQKGLEQIADYLAQNGMKMLKFGEASHADALIYTQQDGGLISRLPVESGPLFLVNVHGKTNEQVLEILKNRLYSPLAL
jgi:hypothetical protein